MSTPYGKIATATKPLRGIECWNFSTDTRFDFPEGTSFRVEHEFDDSHATCMLQVEGKDGGVMLTYEGTNGEAFSQKGYRFIIPNTELKENMGLDIPERTLDVVGGIIRLENGEMDEEEATEFLGRLHDAGVLQNLQGSYQRAYNELVLNR